MSDESQGLDHPGTALARSAALAGTTECGRLERLKPGGEAVNYSWPHRSTLRKSWQWMATPDALKCPSLSRVAHHEAAHAVLMRWIGLGCERAEASATKGQAFFPDHTDKLRDLQAPQDPSGELAATAAAVFAAGMMGELLYIGTRWTGPLFVPEQHDHQIAEEMLRPSFGAQSSAGHAWAQRVALNVLQGRWAEVQAIAGQLIQRGEWRPG